MSDSLAVARDGAVMRIVIARPEQRNSLTPGLLRALARVFAEAEEGVRAAVLSGAGGRAFSAGFDTASLTAEGGIGADGFGANDRDLAAAFAAIEAAPFPVIAAIEGHCIGAGLELALSCDLRIAAEGARFRFPPARIGWTYSAEGLGRLIAAVGPARARRMAYLAETIAAEDAEAWGLVDALTAPDALLDQVEAWLARGRSHRHRRREAGDRRAGARRAQRAVGRRASRLAGARGRQR